MTEALLMGREEGGRGGAKKGRKLAGGVTTAVMQKGTKCRQVLDPINHAAYPPFSRSWW